MMYYLPEECNSVAGINLGHAQKYPELYKNVSSTFASSEFKAAGDAIAKAAGSEGLDSIFDYVVIGSIATGDTTVLRTKAEFDAGALAKLPGAEERTEGGKKYYFVNGFKNTTAKVRIFSPTNRLVVFCSLQIPQATFAKMLNGQGENKEKTPGVRMGDLGKRVTRGTFWSFELYEGGVGYKPKPASTGQGTGGAQPGSNDDGAAQFEKLKSESFSGSKGWGWKASIGSREVRFEVVIWCSDSEKSSNMSKKHRESDLGKGDEGTPPRWWKDKVESVGSKKIAAQLLANVGCGTSGDLFYARSAVETIDLKDGVQSLANKVTDSPAGGGMGAPGMGGGPPGGGPPGGGPPGGGGGGPRPPGMRRRLWARS
jgi:hypothetical protein